MKRKLYFVASIRLQDVGDDIQESTGWKDITVYEIIDNQPKIFAEIESDVTNSSIDEIQVFLDNNGFGDEEFEFTEL